MNVRKALTLFAALVVTAASGAPSLAAVGTNKANGIYTGNGFESMPGARYYSGYRYNSPASSYRESAPATQPAAEPTVAQAPIETGATVDGRRFSYAPTPDTTASSDSVVSPPTQTSPATYDSRPVYSRGYRSGAFVDRWMLPKTDPRKFND